MGNKKQYEKVAFCCPQHGELTNNIEYSSVDMGTRRLVDIPVMYCQECNKYYTPFTNLLALVSLCHKECQVAASQACVEKSTTKHKVRVPHFIEPPKENVRKQQTHIEKAEKEKQYIALGRKEIEQIRMEKGKKYRQLIEDLREVSNSKIILSNKHSFSGKRLCPCCQKKTVSEYVKIRQGNKFLFANIRHCGLCNADYITPEQFNSLCAKASKVIRGFYLTPFISPENVYCEAQENDKYLFIPQWAIDSEKFDQYHLPPHGDEYYDMTDAEYLWVKTLYQPEAFDVRLRLKSFLGEAGYSTNEPETRRHKILEECVIKYGKSKVINQLHSNMNLRMKQKNGSKRYEHAINVWREDIWFIENKL